MSGAAQTKLFGLRIPVDPKILFAGLAAIIVVLFWYNSRSDDESDAPPAAHTEVTPEAAVPLRARTPVSRRTVPASDRGTLRLRPIDPTKGDIDPTLRLDLLARLQRLQPVTGGRSLFESDGLPASGVTVVPVHAPIIRPRPLPNGAMPGGGLVAGGGMGAGVNIPLKYYGYVKPAQALPGSKLATNRGFFLDGDNVVVASEGDLLKQQYLVVELTPNSARLEDTRLRRGQTLPVVPAAMP